MPTRARVVDFDEHVGLGHVRADESGAELLFHCVEIADGTRTIPVGQVVEFDLLRKFGTRRGGEPPSGVTASPMTEMAERFVGVIVALGEGEVVSYGDVAADAGFPGRSRAVGSLLANAPIDLPWWRVVRSDGRLATPPTAGQAALLRAEGVILRGDRVVESPGRPLPPLKTIELSCQNRPDRAGSEGQNGIQDATSCGP